MEFRLLGPLEVIEDGRPLSLGGGKRRALLALLLLHANEIVPAERLIDGLWGDRPPHTAAKSVHVYVSQLRRELQPAGGGRVLMTKGNGYVIALDPDDLDVHRFERGLAEGERALAEGRADRAAERLRDALSLWRGPPLADFSYEPFAQDAIGRLEDMRLLALETRIEADLELGRHAHVIGELESLVRAHPLREGLRRLLMLALYRSGRQADALEVYRSGRALLVEELGLEPGPALRRLQEEILEQSPGLAAPVSPARPHPERTEPPTPTGSLHGRILRIPRRPAAVVTTGAGAVLLAAAALAGPFAGDAPRERPQAVVLDAAPNSLVAVDRAGKPVVAVPLSGRAVDVAAGAGAIWAATVNSQAITAVDTRTGAIARTVALRIRPDAIAADAEGVWIADASRGLLVHVKAGYADVSERIIFGRGRTVVPRGGQPTAPLLALAVSRGAVWIANGSDGLRRVDGPTRRVDRVARGVRLDTVTVGAGAVWATSSRSGSVLRIDPETGNVTARVRLIGRRVSRAPVPVGVAASSDSVWVLNGNTASLTRIDPRTAGIVANVDVGLDRTPRAVAADEAAAWVANGDGTISRVDARSSQVRSIWVGEALRDISLGGSRLWVTTAPVDHHTAGGAG